MPAQQERAQVEAFLRNWQRTHVVTEADFDALKPLGKRALPLLSQYLNDAELGYVAESTMVHIDAVGAMPYLLKNLSSKALNIQSDTFRVANRQMQEYDWYVKAGEPLPNSPIPLPYGYKSAIHSAAVKCLQNEKAVGAQGEALKTLGLTGNRHDRRDITLLRQYALSQGGAAMEGSYRALSIASLARLGDKAALDTIAAALAEPVKIRPARPFITESRQTVEPPAGAVVTPLEDGQRIRCAAFEAGFSMNPRFVEALLRHVDDPPGQFHGDYGDPSPSEYAMNALSQIVCGKEYNAQTGHSPQSWKTKKAPAQ